MIRIRGLPRFRVPSSVRMRREGRRFGNGRCFSCGRHRFYRGRDASGHDLRNVSDMSDTGERLPFLSVFPESSGLFLQDRHAMRIPILAISVASGVGFVPEDVRGLAAGLIAGSISGICRRAFMRAGAGHPDRAWRLSLLTHFRIPGMSDRAPVFSPPARGVLPVRGTDSGKSAARLRFSA